MKKETVEINEQRKTNGLSSISQTILPFAKQILGKKGFVEVDILTNWHKIVGDELADYSFPQKIDFKRDQKNNGILHLNVPSGAFALEIQHREKFILEKINTYFGYCAVSGIKIIQNNELTLEDMKKNNQPEPKKTLVTREEENYIKELADDVNNSELKEILVKLGKSVFNNNKREKKTK